MSKVVGYWIYPHSKASTFTKPSWIKRFLMKLIGVKWVPK